MHTPFLQKHIRLIKDEYTPPFLRKVTVLLQISFDIRRGQANVSKGD